MVRFLVLLSFVLFAVLLSFTDIVFSGAALMAAALTSIGLLLSLYGEFSRSS